MYCLGLIPQRNDYKIRVRNILVSYHKVQTSLIKREILKYNKVTMYYSFFCIKTFLNTLILFTNIYAYASITYINA